MVLPSEAQSLGDQLRALVGVPASQIVVNFSDDGLVQTIEPRIVFRRKKVVEEPKRPAHTTR